MMLESAFDTPKEHAAFLRSVAAHLEAEYLDSTEPWVRSIPMEDIVKAIGELYATANAIGGLNG